MAKGNPNWSTEKTRTNPNFGKRRKNAKKGRRKT